MTFRSRARAALAQALHSCRLLELHRRTTWRDAAVILLYHRVLRRAEVATDLDRGLYVTTDTFEMHLQFILETFEVVHLDDLLEWHTGRRRFSRTPCAITFDDGWIDNYTNAFPLLMRFGVPATVFIITGNVGRPEFVASHQMREMESGGVHFGSHTVTHPVVAGLPAGRLRWEMAESRRQLLGLTAQPSSWFCYPKGYHDEPARKEARRHYLAAVTTRCAVMRREDDLFTVPRVSIHDDITSTPASFALRLAGWTRTPTG